jgi:hypothetical protein
LASVELNRLWRSEVSCKKGVGVDTSVAVQQSHDKRNKIAIVQHPPADYECRKVTQKPGVHDIERDRKLAVKRTAFHQVIHPRCYSFGVAGFVPERDGEARHAQGIGHQGGVDALPHGETAKDRSQ